MSLLTWTVSDRGATTPTSDAGAQRREDVWSGAEVCGALAPQPRSIYSGPEHHGRPDRSSQGACERHADQRRHP